jgi:hypothetical protein
MSNLNDYSSHPSTTSDLLESRLSNLNRLLAINKEHITHAEEQRLLIFIEETQLKTLSCIKSSGIGYETRIQLIDNYLSKNEGHLSKCISSLKRESSVFDPIKVRIGEVVFPQL